VNGSALREAVVRWSRSLFDRGYTAGSSGNISVRFGDGFLVTPTNSCLGFLEPDGLSELDAGGNLVSGDHPTKEWPLHRAFYEGRPAAAAVVHLHSPYATALSCLADIDAENAIPPITPYAVMRVGNVPVIPYFIPGSPEVAPVVRAHAARHAAILLANHGPVVAGASLKAAVFAIEELEQTARLALMLRGQAVRALTTEQIAELEAAFPLS
jgi:ribulose-5-phosphate 4-epimerase/fuculose-1-phosphate aldolase